MTSPLNKKILIVDDEEDMMTVLVESFTPEGFNILKATNGKEALDIALKEHPDIILLDILMPVMDGLKMLEKLRQDEWGKYADVILLTNVDDAERVARAAQEGAFDYFVKNDKTTKEIIKVVKEKLGI